MKAVFTFATPQGMTHLGVLTLCALSKLWVQISTPGSLSPRFWMTTGASATWHQLQPQPMPATHGECTSCFQALRKSWKFEGIQESRLYLTGVPGRDKWLSLCSQEPLSLWPTKWLTSGAWAQTYLDSPLPDDYLLIIILQHSLSFKRNSVPSVQMPDSTIIPYTCMSDGSAIFLSHYLLPWLRWLQKCSQVVSGRVAVCTKQKNIRTC